MSDEADLRAAEEAVGEAEEDASNAKWALRQAEDKLRVVKNRVETNLVARATGPLPIVAGRALRRSCALSEVRGFLAATDHMGCRGVIGGDRQYATNGHLMIDVDTIDGLELIKAEAREAIGSRMGRLVREDLPVKQGSTWCRKLSGITIDLRYSTLVEDLFHGVEWWSSTIANTALAYVGADLVAVVRGVTMLGEP